MSEDHRPLVRRLFEPASIDDPAPAAKAVTVCGWPSCSTRKSPAFRFVTGSP